MNSGLQVSIGATVMVPWGLDMLSGEVVDVYGEGDARRVVVLVDIPGADEKERVTLPIRAISISDADLPTKGSAPGGWFNQRYERSVFTAIARVLESKKVQLVANFTERDHEFDGVVRTESATLLIDVKFGTRLKIESYLSNLQTRLKKFSSRFGPALALVVLNTPPTNLRKMAAQGAMVAPNVTWVQWRGPEDNDRLRTVIEGLI